MTDATTATSLQNVQTTAGFALLHDTLMLQAIQASALARSLVSAGEPPHLGDNVDTRA